MQCSVRAKWLHFWWHCLHNNSIDAAICYRRSVFVTNEWAHPAKIVELIRLLFGRGQTWMGGPRNHVLDVGPDPCDILTQAHHICMSHKWPKCNFGQTGYHSFYCGEWWHPQSSSTLSLEKYRAMHHWIKIIRWYAPLQRSLWWQWCGPRPVARSKIKSRLSPPLPSLHPPSFSIPLRSRSPPLIVARRSVGALKLPHPVRVQPGWQKHLVCRKRV